MLEKDNPVFTRLNKHLLPLWNIAEENQFARDKETPFGFDSGDVYNQIAGRKYLFVTVPSLNKTIKQLKEILFSNGYEFDSYEREKAYNLIRTMERSIITGKKAWNPNGKRRSQKLLLAFPCLFLTG